MRFLRKFSVLAFDGYRRALLGFLALFREGQREHAVFKFGFHVLLHLLGLAEHVHIHAAAHAAQCDDILEKLPQGLDTVVGARGVYLSGGEQQRIALARAILKDAPIVVLDEATAFADPENEHQIQKAFETLTRNKTVLMIAHRLSTVQNADNIIVLNEGKIAEQGSHSALLEKNGVYAAMWADYQRSAQWKVGKEAAV